MKRSSKMFAAVAAAATLAFAGIAFGQPGAGPNFGPGTGPGYGMGMGPGFGMGPGHGMGPGGGMGPGWGPMGGPGHMGGSLGMMGPYGGFDMNAAAAGRLAALKAQLKVTPAQEPAWKAYENTVTQQAAAMQQLRDQFHAQWQNAKPGEAAPDVAAHRQAMFQLRQSSWQAQSKAMQDLYAVLTPEQQALVSGGWGGGPRRR